MKPGRFIKTIAAMAAVAVFVPTLGGCGVSKSEFNSLKERVAALEDIHESELSEGYSNREVGSDSRPTPTPKRSGGSSSGDNDALGGGDFDSAEVGNDIDVTEYDYLDDNGQKYAFFVFENDSAFDVDADVEIECLDSRGETVDRDSKTLRGIESGNRSFAGFELDSDTETIVRTVNYEESNLRGVLLGDMNARAARAQGGVNLTVANNGNDFAENFKYLVIFFESNEMVGFDSNDLPEIGPGENITLPSVCYKDFDRADVFIAIED